MDDPYDQGTFTRPRTQPVQPVGPLGPAGLPDSGPAGEEPPRDPSWQTPPSQPGPPPGDQDAPDEPASAPAGKKRKHFWRELLVIVVFSGQDAWGPDAPPPSDNGFVRLWDDVLSDIGLQSSQTYYIKRVIGLPGDKVACCTDGKVTVNGVPLTETSYLYPGDAPSFPFKTVTVPAGHLWVMGDHRGDSDDSRYHTGDPGGGAVPENEVVGRAFLIIWPPSQLRDLPIPSTFNQAALHAGPAGAALIGAGDVGGTTLSAVAAVPVAGAAAGAGLLGAPWLLLRRRPLEAAK